MTIRKLALFYLAGILLTDILAVLFVAWLILEGL